MRVGVNCFPLDPAMGGIKQYFFSLFRELLAHDRENEYLFFYFDHNVEELAQLDDAGWRNNSVGLRSQRQIAQCVDRMDLFFCPLGVLFPRPLPLPAVVTVPDIQEVYYPHYFTRRNRLARAYHFAGSTRMADRVVTISQFSRESIVRHHRLPGEKVSVARLSADQRFADPAVPGIPPGTPVPEEYVFYPANRWLHKNHDLLLRTVRLLKEERGMRLNVVLTGYDMANGFNVGAATAAYGISDQVRQLGYVTVDNLIYLYRHARALVFPSLFEGFGLPVVEAMAAGCPVLAANATSLPEVGGGAALYFDPRSPGDLAVKLTGLLNSEDLRSDLIRRGRERARLFTPGRMADDHLRAFEEARAGYSRRQYLARRWLYKALHLGKTAASGVRILLS